MSTAKPKLDKLSKKLRAIKAKDIMTKDIVAAYEDSTVADIADVMCQEKVNGIIVLNKRGTSITGIITATDLFILMDMIKSGDLEENGLKAGSNPTVRFAMSTEINTITQSTGLDEIISLMKYKNVHTIPVLQGKKLVGVVRRRDVFKMFFQIVEDMSK